MVSATCCKITAGFSFIVACAIITISFFVPFIVESQTATLLHGLAALSPENYGKWGHIPGDMGVFLKREYYFFNLTNADDVPLHLTHQN